ARTPGLLRRGYVFERTRRFQLAPAAEFGNSPERMAQQTKVPEEQLRLSEERFRLMVESISDYAIFMLDTKGRVASWNEGAQRIKGYTAEEIIGSHISRFYPEAEALSGKVDRELEIAERDGRFEEEGWRVRKDGTTFW